MLILLGKNGAQGRSRTTDTAIFRHVFNQFHQALSQTTNGKPVQETVQLENRGPGTVLSITAESASLAHDRPEPPRSGCPTDSRWASSARVRRYARPACARCDERRQGTTGGGKVVSNRQGEEGVSDSEPVKTPEFSVPLTKEDLAQLGQFNAIWSQVDFLVTVLIGKLANTDMENVLTMTGSATAAPRIAMLKRLAE